jgi:hypothetical protein
VELQTLKVILELAHLGAVGELSPS